MGDLALDVTLMVLGAGLLVYGVRTGDPIAQNVGFLSVVIPPAVRLGWF